MSVTPITPSADGDAVKRAVAYAQNKLGVDEVYQEAEAALSELEDRHDTLHKTSQRRRAAEVKITDREIELVADERGKNAEMSQAAFDRHIKVVFHKDEELHELRLDRDRAASEHERAEYDAERAKLKVRLLGGRMEELGGLLHFYAAARITAANEK